MMPHPMTVVTPRVTLPASVVVCPCGLHHMIRGRRVDPIHCERVRVGRWWP